MLKSFIKDLTGFNSDDVVSYVITLDNRYQFNTPERFFEFLVKRSFGDSFNVTYNLSHFGARVERKNEKVTIMMYYGDFFRHLYKYKNLTNYYIKISHVYDEMRQIEMSNSSRKEKLLRNSRIKMALPYVEADNGVCNV